MKGYINLKGWSVNEDDGWLKVIIKKDDMIFLKIPRKNASLQKDNIQVGKYTDISSMEYYDDDESQGEVLKSTFWEKNISSTCYNVYLTANTVLSYTSVQEVSTQWTKRKRNTVMAEKGNIAQFGDSEQHRNFCLEVRLINCLVLLSWVIVYHQIQFGVVHFHSAPIQASSVEV